MPRLEAIRLMAASIYAAYAAQYQFPTPEVLEGLMERSVKEASQLYDVAHSRVVVSGG